MLFFFNTFFENPIPLSRFVALAYAPRSPTMIRIICNFGVNIYIYRFSGAPISNISLDGNNIYVYQHVHGNKLVRINYSLKRPIFMRFR